MCIFKRDSLSLFSDIFSRGKTMSERISALSTEYKEKYTIIYISVNIGLWTKAFGLPFTPFSLFSPNVSEHSLCFPLSRFLLFSTLSPAGYCSHLPAGSLAWNFTHRAASISLLSAHQIMSLSCFQDSLGLYNI